MINIYRHTYRKPSACVSLTGAQIEDLRVAVGWDRMDGYYDRILARSYTHLTAHDDHCLIAERGRLVAFVNVISDGIADAFLVDLMVHPDYQGRGIGQALVSRAVEELRADGIRAIQVIFDPRLEAFYRACGFHILQSGVIDTWEKVEEGYDQRTV
jgi:GNAT superfamily N-acetyltransferase